MFIDYYPQASHPKIYAWCEHKKYRYIAAGINPFCSLIEKNRFNSIRSNINGVEVIHFKLNTQGIQLPLLVAIFRYKIF